MRYECSMLSPKADIYGLLDDDMSFMDESICQYLVDLINDFDNDPNLGVVSFYNQPSINWRQNFYSTNAGLFYRGGHYYGFEGILPEYLNQFNSPVKTLIRYQNENLINLFGGFDDKFFAMCRLATGNTGKLVINVPVNHHENRPQRGCIAHG